MKRRLVHLAYVLGFPLYSLFSRRFGLTFFFPGRNGWYAHTRGATFRVREPRIWVLEYFRRAVPPAGGLVLDVGGELGYETEQFSSIVGPNGRVIVFECLPSHVARLREIAAARGNVSVVEEACWNVATTLELHVGHTPGSNTAVPDAAGQRGQALADPRGPKVMVRADTLDQQWHRHAGGAPVDFLKMDIEGAELEALEGARELLGSVRHAAIAAYHIRGGQRTSARVAEMLRAAGFKVEIAENAHVYAWRD